MPELSFGGEVGVGFTHEKKRMKMRERAFQGELRGKREQDVFQELQIFQYSWSVTVWWKKKENQRRERCQTGPS